MWSLLRRTNIRWDGTQQKVKDFLVQSTIAIVMSYTEDIGVRSCTTELFSETTERKEIRLTSRNPVSICRPGFNGHKGTAPCATSLARPTSTSLTIP